MTLLRAWRIILLDSIKHFRSHELKVSMLSILLILTIAGGCKSIRTQSSDIQSSDSFASDSKDDESDVAPVQVLLNL